MKIRSILLLVLVLQSKGRRLLMSSRHKDQACQEQKDTFADVCRTRLAANFPPEENEINAREFRWVSPCCDVSQRTCPLEASKIAMPSTTSQAKCTEAGFWTGGVDDVPGFEDFMVANPHICVLHHGAAKRAQASIFGVAMDEAGTLSACSKSLQMEIWGRGSAWYASYHVFKAHESFLMGLKSGVTMRLPVFVGYKFGLKRSGAESVLFSTELGNIFRVLSDLVKFGLSYDRLELNFLLLSHELSCSELFDTPMAPAEDFDQNFFGNVGRESCTLRQFFDPGLQGCTRFVATLQGAQDRIQRERLQHRMNVLCKQCGDGPEMGGPKKDMSKADKEEIRKCYDALYSHGPSNVTDGVVTANVRAAEPDNATEQ